MIALTVVSPALAATSRSCLTELRDRLAPLAGAVTVAPLGSSFYAGSLSKSDIDLLVVPRQAAFETTVETLGRTGRSAQRENWSSTFASFSLDLPSAAAVGVQVCREDASVLPALRLQMQSLEDPDFRRRYDIAKTHGAGLGTRGYWLVKDVFWRRRGRPGPQWTDVAAPVLKILRPTEWDALLADEKTKGAPVDIQDGFVHLSTPEQVDETVARHFAGASDLWLLTLDASDLPELRWEPSRGGALFPHLYAPLRLSDVYLARPWGASSWPDDRSPDVYRAETRLGASHTGRSQKYPDHDTRQARHR